MYKTFYGLKEKPFKLLPDAEYIYMSTGHENAYTHLEYAVLENKGFAVITGEIGSGKTTLINYLLDRIEDDIQLGLINNTHVSPTQLVKMICQDFEIDVRGLDKAEIVDRLQNFLIRRYAEKKRVILVIDEAQNLPAKSMEELRMLSNLESDKDHLIHIILVGQPDLMEKIRRLPQFAQRVTVYSHLDVLSKDEVAHYIHYRLKIGGTERSDIFSPAAIETISEYSRGIPRLINIVCDAALVYGFADGIDVIDQNTVTGAVESMGAGVMFQNASEPHVVDSLEDSAKDGAENLLLLENRFKLIETRLQLFEKKVESLAHGSADSGREKDSRDEMIIEMLQLLKNRDLASHGAAKDDLTISKGTSGEDVAAALKQPVAPPSISDSGSSAHSEVTPLASDLEIDQEEVAQIQAPGENTSNGSLFSQLLDKIESDVEKR